MTYLFLLYSDETVDDTPAPDDAEGWAAYMEPWESYTAALVEAGVMRGGEALHPTTAASTVSRADGKTVVTDGPFAATREQLGGFYMVECADLDQALAWAAKCPVIADGGRVEVRPVMDMG